MRGEYFTSPHQLISALSWPLGTLRILKHTLQMLLLVLTEKLVQLTIITHGMKCPSEFMILKETKADWRPT
jgi:hypothetical protein